MFRQLYVGATGMSALEKDMVTITNNVANSKTVGYKKSRVEMENIFPQVLAEAVTNMDLGSSQPAGIELGSGVRVVGTPKDFSQGAIEVTDNELDIAVNGTGFFMFRTSNDEIAYSRAGNLNRDNYGNIVDPNGNLLEPGFVIPEETASVRIAADGTVSITLSGETSENEIGQITLASFPNPSGLESIGNNLYTQTIASGDPLIGEANSDHYGAVSQYALESSNVDIISSDALYCP